MLFTDIINSVVNSINGGAWIWLLFVAVSLTLMVTFVHLWGNSGKNNKKRNVIFLALSQVFAFHASIMFILSVFWIQFGVSRVVVTHGLEYIF